MCSSVHNLDGLIQAFALSCSFGSVVALSEGCLVPVIDLPWIDANPEIAER
jgi:hypothetical protein